MKKRMVAIVALAGLIFAVASSASQPGTQEDPLVTKSYIDSVVYPSTRFKVIDVPAEKSVICSAGTEIILRQGVCTVIGNQNGGLSDVTMGYDLSNATVIQGNHLLVVPLDDGRGVWTATACKLMIKGGYQILN